MITRRSFLRYAGGTTLTLVGIDRLTGRSRVLACTPGRVAGSSLDREVHDAPAGAARDAEGGQDRLRGGKNVDYYEISMRQFAQQILPAGMPATTVWGYGPWHRRARRACSSTTRLR